MRLKIRSVEVDLEGDNTKSFIMFRFEGEVLGNRHAKLRKEYTQIQRGATAQLAAIQRVPRRFNARLSMSLGSGMDLALLGILD